jgi:hypothetical protein
VTDEAGGLAMEEDGGVLFWRGSGGATWGMGGAGGGAEGGSRGSSWLAVGVVPCGVMFWGPSSSEDVSSSSRLSSCS